MLALLFILVGYSSFNLDSLTIVSHLKVPYRLIHRN